MNECDELELKANVIGHSARVVQATPSKGGVRKSSQTTKAADGHRANRALRWHSPKKGNAPGRMPIINSRFVIQEKSFGEILARAHINRLYVRSSVTLGDLPGALF